MVTKVSQQIEIVRSISQELAKRYDIDDIIYFANAFGLNSDVPRWEDDYDFAKKVISQASLQVLAEIIEDLGLEAFSSVVPPKPKPALWEDNASLRVFISHLSSEKVKATRLRDVMNGRGMSAFVAHEDIEPSLEWQVQIERALNNMELFVSMHTKGFSASMWTQQEVGYAVSTGVKIIALRMDEDLPVSFTIDKPYQEMIVMRSRWLMRFLL